MKIRLLAEVRGDFPIGHRSVAEAGVYEGDNGDGQPTRRGLREDK